MARLGFVSALLVLVGFAAWRAGGWTGVATASITRSALGASVVLNEVQYDPPPGGAETAYEWVELLNTGLEPVSLEGWRIADNRAADDLPAVPLGPGEILVVAGGEGFAELHPGFAGRLATLGGSIGNGLGNSGDQVRLLDASGGEVDAMSYGDDAGALDPPAPTVEAGHSLERVPAGTDTDAAGDWEDRTSPSPGQPAEDLGPTPSVPPPTMPPGAGAVLNEYLPAPRDIDWDGDGVASPNDEWVELFNPGDVAIDLRGWQLDDVADGGSAPFVFPDRTVIAARGHLLIFARDSGLALNNGGDSVRLVRPDGAVADEAAFARAAPDASFARQGDGVGPWTDALPPSPGAPNGGDLPTATDGPPAPSATPFGPHPTSSPGPTGGVPTAATTPTTFTTPGTPVPTPAGVYLPFLVSEVLFDPLEAGNDAAWEWVEIYNRSDAPASLAGWAIGDATAWDGLPDVWVGPRRHAVVLARAALSSSLGLGSGPVAAVADGRIGNGLANGGDLVRLRGPTGEVADAVSYGANLEAFDPAVPIGPPGASVERLPSDVDTDTAEDWWPQPAPSPGRAGTRHVGPPAVVLNEVLPAPARVDWDGDGAASHLDEWVELFNASDAPADLRRWRLEDGVEEGWSFAFPEGAVVAPHGFRVVHRAESGLALDNAAEVVRLVRDDGVVADRLAWSRSPGRDRAWARSEDGAGAWTDAYDPTPGGPNLAGAPRATDSGADAAPSGAAAPDRARDVSPGAVRALPSGTRVRVRGRITAAPGAFGDRTAYLEDASGGVRLFLRPRERLPDLLEGEVAVAVGRLRDYHGEREVELARPTDLWSEPEPGGPRPLVPHDLRTAGLDEAAEGRLVRLSGNVTAVSGGSLVLDDGSGPAKVSLRRLDGSAWPRATRGARLVVVGIAGQAAARSPWVGGYRLQPRRPADVDVARAGGPLPARLPRTGGGGGACPHSMPGVLN